ncbi:MAG: hypothetical protein AAGJ28_19710 [Pseudomonadota bacterium]
MPFSVVSEAVVLFSFGAPLWHMLMISRAGGHPVRRTVIIALVMIAWSAWAYLAVRTGFDQDILGPVAPGRPMIYLILAMATTWSARHWLLGDGVSQHLLIALQLFRPIGMVFVLENSRGTLPGIFAHPAGWGDLAAGLLAAYVLWRYWGRAIPDRCVIAVAVVGLADFASAFFFGFTSSDTPVQLFSHDFPNQVLNWPLGLIPLFLVPYAVMAHLLSLAQLARDRAARPGVQPVTP